MGSGAAGAYPTYCLAKHSIYLSDQFKVESLFVKPHCLINCDNIYSLKLPPRCPLFETDARECVLCSGDFWSNDAHDACVPKIIEFLAFGEPLGITLIVIAAFGALLTIAVGVRNTHTITFFCLRL